MLLDLINDFKMAINTLLCETQLVTYWKETPKHQGIKDVSSLIWATFVLSFNIVSELCGGVRPIWIYVSSWDSSDPNTWDPDAQ